MVLLQQFHDILPGSSIAWVHADAERNHAAITAGATEIIEAALAALAGGGETAVAVNAAPHAGSACPRWVPRSPSRPAHRPPPGVSSEGDLRRAGQRPHPGRDRRRRTRRLAGRPRRRPRGDQPRRAAATGCGCTGTSRPTGTPGTSTSTTAAPCTSSTRSTTITRRGAAGAASPSVVRRRSVDRSDSGSCWPPGRTPSSWSTRSTGTSGRSCSSSVSASTCTPTRSAAETQFGHLFRATHTNTSWEDARFEICAHRFVHIGEPGYGVAVTNDSTYGHDVSRHTRADGGTTTTVRPVADARAALPRPVRRPGRAHPEGRRPARRHDRRRRRGGLPDQPAAPGWCAATTASRRWSRSSNPGVVVEAVKLADDRSGDVIVRLYESRGARAEATVTADRRCRLRWWRPICSSGPAPPASGSAAT